MSDIDIELKRQFAELRATDELHAPDFGTLRDVASRTAAGPARLPTRWLTLGAIAAAAACVALAFFVAQRTRTDARVAEVWWTPDALIDVSHFASPTDGLLRSARHTLETRALFESVLDGVTTPIQPTPSKGD